MIKKMGRASLLIVKERGSSKFGAEATKKENNRYIDSHSK